MSSAFGVSPLMTLLNVPVGSRDQAAIRALLTANPKLANTPLNANAPGSLPLSFTLTTSDIPTSALLVEFHARADKQPLAEAAWPNSLETTTWVYTSGLDTDVTTDPVGLGTSVLARTGNTDATILPVLDFLVSKGLVLKPDVLLLALQQFPGVVKYAVAKGFLTLDVYTSVPMADGRTLLTWAQLNDYKNPFTYAALPDGSNALFVAVSAAPLTGPAPASLLAAIAAAKAAGTLEAVFANSGTALFYALCRGSATAASALLAAGANDLYKAATGETCVGAAARSQQASVVNLIMSTISTNHGPAAATAALNAVYTNSRGAQKTALTNAIQTYAPVALFTALMALNADPTKATNDGVPPAAWLGYAVQGAASRLGAAPFDANGIFRVLAAGNAAGVKPALDTYVPVLRATVRDFNAQHGVTL